MDVGARAGVLRSLTSLPDPRMKRTRKHELLDLMAIAICGVICGADGWTQIAAFGRAKRKWFKTFLPLPHGIPSHDTFGRVFARLDPVAFERCFLDWMAALAQKTFGRLIALDGKTLRGSFDAAAGRSPLHLVSAWCEQNQTVLGQWATAAKSNEITAIPALLELLDIEGAGVTTDAMGCQTALAEKIVAGQRRLHSAGQRQAAQTRSRTGGAVRRGYPRRSARRRVPAVRGPGQGARPGRDPPVLDDHPD